GTLVKNGDNTYTYTSKDQWKENFNTSGQETSLVDPHGLAITYTYSSGQLANVSTPDGGLVTLTYTSFQGHQLLSTIAESGGRSVTVLRHMGFTMTGITDPDSSLRTFTYSGSSQLINDQWSPLNATYNYDATTALL